MAVQQRLTTDGGGRAVLVKSATGADLDGLAHELAMLRAAAHPGVVEILAESRLDDGLEITLAVAGSRTVADVRTDIAGIAGLVAALATTVGDLHELGIVHGRICAEHVVVDRTGRPVLCGFGGAGASGSAPGLTPADDVAGLGTLLGQLLDRGPGTGASWEPIPAGRFLRPRARDRWSGFVLRALQTIADHATADDPARRPTARGLANAILATLPDARLPDAGRPDAGRPDAPLPDAPLTGVEPDGGEAGLDQPVRARRLLTPLTATVGLGLLIFGVGGLLRPPASPPRPAAASPADTDASATAPTTTASFTTASFTTASSTTAMPPGEPAGSTTTRPAPPPTAPAAAATLAVEIADGVVTMAGVRYAVGAPGDVLAVADWDCDGQATVAALRPATGAVFVFDGWAATGADRTVAATATVPGAVGLEDDDDDGDGCPSLVAIGADGTRTEVRW